MNQLSGEDRIKAYRIKVRQYSDEEGNLWEDVRLGEKDKRDVLIHLLWETGRMSNQEIGSWFGLTYSSISKIVSSVNDRIHIEKNLKAQFDVLNSQFKV